MSTNLEQEKRSSSTTARYTDIPANSVYLNEPNLSPKYFGPEGGETQLTGIAEESLLISKKDFEQIHKITSSVADFISDFSLIDNPISLGEDVERLRYSCDFDNQTGSEMIYGGLDIYKCTDGTFKVLEINSQVQAMGLQDYRLASLGLFDQPMIMNHFIDFIKASGHERTIVLGSTKNAFWRGHLRLSQALNYEGIDTHYTDIQNFIDVSKSSHPDMVMRCCNPGNLLYQERGFEARDYLLANKVPVFNGLSSWYFGSRGFLSVVGLAMPDYFPKQVVFDKNTSGEILEHHPWIKLEAPGVEYVANYNHMRRWWKDCIFAMIKSDFQAVNTILDSKDGQDAQKLKSISKALSGSDMGRVVWIGQEDIPPSFDTLHVDGEQQQLSILYRAYWVKNFKGGISTSLEAFGCRRDQLSGSKGKINAGTGIAIPIRDI